MDNILDKFGLYDFFGLLIPGMFFLIMLFYMDFPLIKEEIYPSSQAFKILVFILVSYILGTLMQEIASFVDENYIKMRINAREKFLDSDKHFFEEDELKEVKKIANKLLKKDRTNNCFTTSECSKLFFQCKAYLENNDKMQKVDKLDAIFAMSRDFIVCNIAILCCLLITIVDVVIERAFSCSLSYIVIFIYTLASSIIFYRRAKRYSELRTKTIIRQYMDLKRG